MDQQEDQDGITAYHGSPHDFDQFDISKIGTGEGAQAFGHGLYFAQNPATAQEYRERLAGRSSIDMLKLGDMQLTPQNNFDYSRNAGRSMMDNIHSSLAENVMLDEHSLLGASDKQKFVLSKLADAIENYKNEWPEAVPHAQKLYDKLSRPGAVAVKMGEQPGKTYEVHINAHPDHFLDWDKPVSEQSPYVKSMLEKIASEDEAKYGEGGGLHYYILDPDSYSGESIYHYLQSQLRANGASETLHQNGIKGIKYLDANSRTPPPNLDPDHIKGQIDRNRVQAEKTTDEAHRADLDDDHQILLARLAKADKMLSRNFVVFDDKLVTTKRKYARGGGVQFTPLEA